MSFLNNLLKQKPAKSGIIFIVEDNPVYAKSLETFLKLRIPLIKEIKVFPAGEICLMSLTSNPDVIIIDHFLNSKYHDAETGLEIIKQIRSEKPETNIIAHSSQTDIDVAVKAIKQYQCNYVKKDNEAFKKIERMIMDIYGLN